MPAQIQNTHGKDTHKGKDKDKYKYRISTAVDHNTDSKDTK